LSHKQQYALYKNNMRHIKPILESQRAFHIVMNPALRNSAPGRNSMMWLLQIRFKR
jgi:hypothetical protein